MSDIRLNELIRQFQTGGMNDRDRARVDEAERVGLDKFQDKEAVGDQTTKAMTQIRAIIGKQTQVPVRVPVETKGELAYKTKYMSKNDAALYRLGTRVIDKEGNPKALSKRRAARAGFLERKYTKREGVVGETWFKDADDAEMDHSPENFKKFFKLKKKNAKDARVAAFETLVHMEGSGVSPANVIEYGGPNAKWDKKRDAVAVDKDDKKVGFGRRYISKRAATRAFNKFNASNRYKTHGSRAGAIRRDICTKATPKNRSATSSYLQNPRAKNFRNLDDGSQCMSKYNTDARTFKNRTSAWRDFVVSSHAEAKASRVPAKSMKELGALWRAKKAAECKD